MRKVLGSHVEQAGQLVNERHVRFDFTHFSALTPEELLQVENLVNQEILKAVPVSVQEMGIEEARLSGAMALFGEKYGDVVRVVSVEDGFSKELCGGTHMDNTARLGLFKILSESSVASGVRRIEGVTAMGVLFFHLFSFGDSMDMIVIGSIVPLLPGVPLTNSIRNFLENDYLSGLIRFVDAFLTAGCIAIGVGVALRFWMFAMGGML